MAGGYVILNTKDEDKAGTDLIVEVRVGGDWINLDLPDDDREKGSVNTYWVPYMPQEVSFLSLRVCHNDRHLNSPEWYDAWCLDWIAAIPEEYDGCSTFYHYNKWIKVPPGDDSWHYIENIQIAGRATNQAMRLLATEIGGLLFDNPGVAILKEIGLPGNMIEALGKLFKPTTF
jgi:hypothetical protein